MQGVQGDPTTGIGDSGLVVALLMIDSDQALQGSRQGLAQPFRLEELPLVKVGAIRQIETGQEIIAIEGDRLGQGVETVGGSLRAIGQALLKLVYVEPELDRTRQADPLAVGG